MKNVLRSLALAVSLVSSPVWAAGTCDILFTQIETWLAGEGHLIRVVTTMAGSENRVTYTRGYMNLSEDFEGLYESSSAIYMNDGTVESPFQRRGSGAKITLQRSGPDAAQLILSPEGGSSSVYLMRCLDGLLTSVTDEGVLTASFRYSSTN